jgi:transcriptional regulator with XRE-family HTH domain
MVRSILLDNKNFEILKDFCGVMMKANNDIFQLGANIRKVRKEKRISLEQMAAGTDLSISFLSQLECGKANISVENLKKITDFLDISMVRLFEIEERQRLGAVTRKGEGMVLKVEGSTAYCESLIRKSGPNLQATLYINPPGEGRKAPMSHIGEELVYVIRGELTYYLNDQEYHLREGDLMYYRSESLHSWYNPGKWENVIFVVNTPPNW